jgi:hypothetical protein
MSLLNLIFPLGHNCCTQAEINLDDGINQSKKTLPNTTMFQPIVNKRLFGLQQAPASSASSSFDCIEGKLGLILDDGLPDTLHSSLLFQAALTAATNGPYKVIMVTTKTSSDLNPQKPVIHGMPSPDMKNLSLIHFVYPRTLIELCLYLTALASSTYEELPGLVILENLDDFLSSSSSSRDDNFAGGSSPYFSQMTKILALLRDLANRIILVGKSSNNCSFQCIASCRNTTKINEDKEEDLFAKFHLFADEVWKSNISNAGKELRLSSPIHNHVQHHCNFDQNKSEDLIILTSITRETTVLRPLNCNKIEYEKYN